MEKNSKSCSNLDLDWTVPNSSLQEVVLIYYVTFKFDDPKSRLKGTHTVYFNHRQLKIVYNCLLEDFLFSVKVDVLKIFLVHLP